MRKPWVIKTDNKHSVPVNVDCVAIDQIDSLPVEDVAYWLIDMRIWQDGWQTLCQVRRHLSPKVYLRPVVFLMESMEMPAEIQKAADGHINLVSVDNAILEDWVSRVEPVNHWINHLAHVDEAQDTNIAFKVLRLITSRNMELEPVTTVRRNSGYVYPILEPLFGKRDTGVMETLSFLESQHLLTGKYVSKAHYCSHCGSAFLNFKESCPHCSSDDLAVDELVHHFKCAYIAEMSEFKHGDHLQCPKCERELRHIGVDYDKPSMVFHCNQCSHTFQDPKIMVACYNCGRSTEPENQIVKVIQSYSVSAIGLNAAEYGLEALFTNILDSELRLYSINAFHDFFHVEAARISRYKISSSSLAMIQFRDIDQLYIKLGGRAQEVFAELSAIFKSVLRQSDIITARNESIFFVIMTETKKQEAYRAIERLQEDVVALFKNNLDFSPQLVISIEAIDEQMDLEKTLEDFLGNHAV
ncbi:MAG TPA: hypothetical protein ENI65_03280 [Gammaproteobacteria bacterium]|nr:hypothetical protein [Gammaproteobacteria bacterium]